MSKYRFKSKRSKLIRSALDCLVIYEAGVFDPLHLSIKCTSMIDTFIRAFHAVANQNDTV